MRKQGTNIDPFNAGEPVLPWCDPETYDVDSGESIDDDQGSRHEYPDDADDSDAFHDRKRKGTASKNTASRKERGSSSRKRSGEASSKRAKQRAASKTRTSREAAHNPVRGRGKHRVFLTVLLLILFFSFASSVPRCISSMFSFLPADSDEPFVPEAPSDGPSLYPDELNDDQNACLNAALTRLEQLTTPGTDAYQQAAAMITSDFNEECEYYLCMSADELGLDSDAVAAWLIESLQYEISSVHAFPEDDDPYGSVYLDATVADPLSLYGSFFDPASDYLIDHGYEGYPGDPEPDAAAREHIAKLLQDAISLSTEVSEPFVRLEMIYVDGTWSVSETEYLSELDFIFGM